MPVEEHVKEIHGEIIPRRDIRTSSVAPKVSHEILILRRFGGYLRLHIPPVIYSPKIASQLQTALKNIKGVRRVFVKHNLGRVSVHYDKIFTSEKELLLLIDRIASPALDQSKHSLYEKTFSRSKREKRVRQIEKTVTWVTVAYLIRVHWMVARGHWFRRPLKNWLPWLSIIAAIYLHKRSLKRGLRP